MKKQLFAAAAAAAFTASAAFAQATDTLIVNVQADVDEYCTISSDSGQTLTVDRGTLNSIPVGQWTNTESQGGQPLTYRCNAAGGFTRTVSSQNNGFLHRDGTSGGAGNEIRWEFRSGGGSGLNALPWVHLVSDLSTTVPASRAVEFLGNGQRYTSNYRVEGVQQGAGTSVFAGDYSDVVTITVAGAF
jgi:type 1 fimbria pilin